MEQISIIIAMMITAAFIELSIFGFFIISLKMKLNFNTFTLKYFLDLLL